MPKMGNSQMRLEFGIWHRETVEDWPRFPKILWESRVIHLSPKMFLSRYLIAIKNWPSSCPNQAAVGRGGGLNDSEMVNFYPRLEFELRPRDPEADFPQFSTILAKSR